MNATKWNSLTEFVKYLGRESICRVEDTEKGLHISWIDNSPEALKRQEALRRKALQDQGDEELETRMIREQIRRAQAAAQTSQMTEEEKEAKEQELKLAEAEGLKISFGPKLASKDAKTESPPTAKESPGEDENPSASKADAAAPPAEKLGPKPTGLAGFSMKASSKPQVKNVFAQAKKDKKVMSEQPKKMSEAERIMKEEMERKRARDTPGFGGPSAKKRKNF